MTSRWMSSKPATSGLLTAAAAAFLLSGCSDQEDRTAYCVDRETNKVADNSRCDGNGGGGAFFFMGGLGGYGRGQVLPAGPRANVNDPAAREKLGIARTGSVGAKGGFGTTVKSSGGGSGGGFSSGGRGSGGG